MNEQTIFTAAVEREPAERRAFLDGACGADKALRERVEKLIGLNEKAGNFLDRPAAGVSPTVDQARLEQPGTVIGPYKLLQQIGEGGMGTVFMAEQTHPVRRKVALKVIKQGMDTNQVIARFEAERQALAMMDHVHIARVLDAGATDAGRPYFVMELVHGVPITKYCDDNQLTPRERLELFVPVCQAIQHAHTKGIIHRDVKPSNILVTLYDGRPVPKVIDFGVAKATEQKLTERTLFTQFGTMVGTLEYMSPEQAEMSALGVDTRSDIYSLGVLLYELLTGSTPLTRKRLKEAAYGEILRMIREEEPPKPSTRLSESGEALASISVQRKTEPAKLSKLMRGELDWMVMKTLEKDRNRRYETASGLALDIQRYLLDEPVQACPPSAAYRLRKFTRRNKGPVLAAAVILVSLVGGIVGTAWGLVRAEWARLDAVQAENRIAIELKEKEKQYQRAEANFLKTLEAVDQLLTEVGQKEMASIPHLENVRRRLLEKALKFFQEFLREKQDDPTVRFETGLAYRRLSDIQRLLGQHGPAEKAGDQAIDLLGALRTDEPERSTYRNELARAFSSRALLLAELGRTPAAESDYQQAQLLLETLAAQDPSRPEFQADLGGVCNRWGMLLVNSGSNHEAERLLRKGASLMEELAARYPDRADYPKVLAKCYGNLANVMQNVSQPDEAEKAFHRGIEVVGQSLARFDGDQDFRLLELLNQNNFGLFLWHTGKIAEAVSMLREGTRLGESLVADFPGIPTYREQLARLYGNLGNLLWTNERSAQAEEPLNRALAITEKLATDFPTVPDHHSNLGQTLNSLALLLRNLGRPAEARALLERALERQQAAVALNPKHRAYRGFLCDHATNLSIVLEDLGAPAAELESAFERPVAFSRALVADYPEDADFQCRLGACLSNQAGMFHDSGQLQRALPLLQEAVACQQEALKAFPRNPLFRGHLRNHRMLLFYVLLALDSPQAEQACRDALAMNEQMAADFPTVATYRGELATCHYKLGVCLTGLGKSGEAEAALRAAVTIQEKLAADFPMVPEYRRELAESHNYLGVVLIPDGIGKQGQAEAELRAALTIRERLTADFPTVDDYQNELAGTLVNVADLRNRSQDCAAALPLLEQARPRHMAVLAASPETPLYRQFYRNHLQVLAQSHLGLGDHAQAAATADQLAAFGYDPANDAYDAACFLCGCVPLAENDAALTEAKRKDLTRGYSDRALALLRQAAARGFKNAAHMKQDTDLDPLRKREEFQQLIAELERTT